MNHPATLAASTLANMRQDGVIELARGPDSNVWAEVELVHPADSRYAELLATVRGAGEHLIGSVRDENGALCRRDPAPTPASR